MKSRRGIRNWSGSSAGLIKSELVPDNTPKTFFSAAEKTGMIALGGAVLLLFIHPFLAAVPLVVFLVLCFCAPFFPQYSFFLPVISRGLPGSQGVALTFDDGPSPTSTPVLLELLARHKLQATFFVVGEKAAKYPELIAEIIAHGHTIGNHSWQHDNFLMLRSRKTVQQDIHATQTILQAYGVQPLVFRPPVGITSPRVVNVLATEGLVTVTFSCRALDRGNRNIHNLAEKILSRLQPGDIIMLHDLPPCRQALADYWQQELDSLFSTLARTVDVVTLAQIIGRPVMKEHIPLQGLKGAPDKRG